MATRKVKPPMTAEELHAEWVARLGRLVDQVEEWAREADWATRQIEIPLREDELGGRYLAPALLLQFHATKVMLEPYARMTGKWQGVVDFYEMPAYERMAMIYYQNKTWHIRSRSAPPEGEALPHDIPPGLIPDGPLTRESVLASLNSWLDRAR